MLRPRRVPIDVGAVKLIDSTLVIVPRNDKQEIDCELAPPAEAPRVALTMLARNTEVPDKFNKHGRDDARSSLTTAPSPTYRDR
jgi:hypothetical protein